MKKIFIYILIILIVIAGILIWQFCLRQAKDSWLVYGNEEYGFEIRYPNDWVIEEDLEQYNSATSSIHEKYRLDIYHPEEIGGADRFGNVVVEFFTQDNPGMRFENMVDLLQRGYTDGVITEVELRGISGWQAYVSHEMTGIEGVEINKIFYPIKDGKILRILGFAADIKGGRYKKNVEEIISTFKLLD